MGDQHGEIGPTTQSLLCEHSRMSWGCRSLLDSGILSVLLQMATQRHLCGAERPRSSMAASACWQQWDTERLSSQASFPECFHHLKVLPLIPSQTVWEPSQRCPVWDGDKLYCTAVEAAGANNRGDAPGDFGWKLITSSDPEAKRKKLAAEIANGRLAMMAIIGMFFQDGLTGSAWGDWSVYTASPLRAFESELGVQDPVGFWDPLGLATDGNVQTFNRRRTIEFKHGRVSMLACMGYITPEYTKFPGFLSPSQRLKFSDIPNGLAAISKVPACELTLV